MTQRLWKLTQPTDDWLPADDDARETVSRRQQQEAAITMSPHRRVADASYCRSVERIGSRVRPHDVTDDVIDHVTVSGHINTAVDRRDLDS